MIEKFTSYEEAALFVGEKQAEGYHACITNEAVGFLWGPRTTGGFRVYVSDEPIPESSEPVPSMDTDDIVTKLIRYAVLIVVGIGSLAGLFFLLAALPTVLKLLVTLGLVILGGYFIFNRDIGHPPS